MTYYYYYCCRAIRKIKCNKNLVDLLLEDKLSSRSDCSVYFWSLLETYSRRIYTNAIVNRIQAQLDGPEALKKFVLVIKNGNLNEEKLDKFRAIDLRGLTHSVDD